MVWDERLLRDVFVTHRIIAAHAAEQKHPGLAGVEIHPHRIVGAGGKGADAVLADLAPDRGVVRPKHIRERYRPAVEILKYVELFNVFAVLVADIFEHIQAGGDRQGVFRRGHIHRLTRCFADGFLCFRCFRCAVRFPAAGGKRKQQYGGQQDGDDLFHNDLLFVFSVSLRGYTVPRRPHRRGRRACRTGYSVRRSRSPRP